MELYLASPIAANIVQGFLVQGLIGADTPAAGVQRLLDNPREVVEAFSPAPTTSWQAGARRFFEAVVQGLEASGLSLSCLRKGADSDRRVFEGLRSFLTAEGPADGLATQVFEGLRQYVVTDPRATALLPLRASERDYGDRRLDLFPGGSGLRFLMRDGRQAEFDVEHSFVLKTDDPTARKVVRLQVRDSRGDLKRADFFDPLRPQPTVGELMRRCDLKTEDVVSATDRATFEVSPYATPFYRRFSRPETAELAAVVWEKMSGRVSFPGGSLEKVTSRGQIADYFGPRLRAEALAILRQAQDKGLEISETTFPQYLARRYPGGSWTKLNPKAAQEAHVYAVQDASGATVGLMKYFKGYPRDPFAADTAFDQLLALARCQAALDREGIEGIRYPKIYAAGTSWIFREWIPEEGFRLADEDLASLGQYAFSFSEKADAGPDFRLMSRVLWTSVGGEVRGRNVAKVDGRYVIYDPI
jgi:hypothetical protein